MVKQIQNKLTAKTIPKKIFNDEKRNPRPLINSDDCYVVISDTASGSWIKHTSSHRPEALEETIEVFGNEADACQSKNALFRIRVAPVPHSKKKRRFKERTFFSRPNRPGEDFSLDDLDAESHRVFRKFMNLWDEHPKIINDHLRHSNWIGDRVRTPVRRDTGK